MSDMEQLMDMAKEFHRENVATYAVSEEKVRKFMELALSGRGGIIGVIGDQGALEAAIYLLISTHWYSDAWHLEELINFVRPAFRKSNNAKELIAFAKRCADELEIPLAIGVISNIRTAAKIRLYERQLAKPAGAFFVYTPGVVNG